MHYFLCSLFFVFIYLNSFSQEEKSSYTSTNKVSLPPKQDSTKLYIINKRRYSYKSYLLYGANYVDIAKSNTKYSYYNIRNADGDQVGYALSNNLKKYKIFDNSSNQWGYVAMKSQGYYIVYDNNGHKLYTNKPKSSFFRL